MGKFMYSCVMNELIKNFAQNLGFHLVSIIPAYSLIEEKKHLTDWIKSGYAADLSYMKENFEKRADPEKNLQNAKSIISLGMNYYQQREDELAKAKVARYAWGKDYHLVIEKKLKKIRKFIIENSKKEISKKDFKLYCDAGPVLERAYAARAGLGFVGKNTTLITKEYGSWVFLAEIITTLELDYDKPQPVSQSCGECTKCIDACPAKALKEPYVIDANKCISYQTIEKKGKAEGNLSGYIFGCDICQEVCPHNSRAKKTDVKEFVDHRAGPNLDINEIQKMTESEFAEKYKGSPIKRAGLKKLKSTGGNMVSSTS